MMHDPFTDPDYPLTTADGYRYRQVMGDFDAPALDDEYLPIRRRDYSDGSVAITYYRTSKRLEQVRHLVYDNRPPPPGEAWSSDRRLRAALWSHRRTVGMAYQDWIDGRLSSEPIPLPITTEGQPND